MGLTSLVTVCSTVRFTVLELLTLPGQKQTSDIDVDIAPALPSKEHTSTAVNVLPSRPVDTDVGKKQQHLNWATLQHIHAKHIMQAHQSACSNCSDAGKQSHDAYELSLKFNTGTTTAWLDDDGQS